MTATVSFFERVPRLQVSSFSHNHLTLKNKKVLARREKFHLSTLLQFTKHSTFCQNLKSKKAQIRLNILVTFLTSFSFHMFQFTTRDDLIYTSLSPVQSNAASPREFDSVQIKSRTLSLLRQKDLEDSSKEQPTKATG